MTQREIRQHRRFVLLGHRSPAVKAYRVEWEARPPDAADRNDSLLIELLMRETLAVDPAVWISKVHEN